MSTRNAAGYSENRTRLDHQDEYRNEDLSGSSQVHYPGAGQRDGQEPNDFGKRALAGELRHINEAAATAFTEQHDLTGYDPGDRKSIVGAYTQGFNLAHPATGNQRWEAAEDLSLAVYRPMYERLELEEAQGQTGYTASTQGLERHREEFAATLYNSFEDPAVYSGLLNEKLEHSNAYARGESQSSGRVNFRSVRDERDEYLRELAIGIEVDSKFSPAHEAIDRLQGAAGPRAEGAWQASNAIAEIYRSGLQNAVERGNENGYNRIMEQAESGSAEFTNAVREDTGFVNAAGYEQPGLPERFANVAQAQDYADRMEDALDGVNWENGGMNPTHYAAAKEMTATFQRTLELIGQTETLTDSSEDYRRLHQMGQGIDYLTRPR